MVSSLDVDLDLIFLNGDSSLEDKQFSVIRRIVRSSLIRNGILMRRSSDVGRVVRTMTATRRYYGDVCGGGYRAPRRPAPCSRGTLHAGNKAAPRGWNPNDVLDVSQECELA